MVTLQRQAKALGDPTRYAIFSAVTAADRPIGIAELNESFDLHPNAIRQHLAHLVEAGLVIDGKAPPSGRGRPRLVYRSDPAMVGRWGTEGPYQELSGILAEVIATGRNPLEVGRDAGQRLRVTSPSGDIVADVAASMARQGFDPDVHSTAAGAEIVLRRCPFASAAEKAAEAVCAVHRGIAEGLVDGGGAMVADLVVQDPRRAGCRLVIEVEASGD